MAKHSMKMGGKEVGPAKVYATRAFEAVDELAKKPVQTANNVNMSVGNIARDPNAGATKTTGIKVRGTGAATKGTMARGPMA